ncbi:hypothetical protein HDE_08453 [Halotydeus destructor]|nr:hypothetical protein HDE_08453 [Halotydeus destructor]
MQRPMLGLFILVLLASNTMAGPLLYGICQAGCATVAVACYAAGGAVFGTVLAAAASPAIAGCNSAFGTCSAACAKVTLGAPTP